MDTTTTDTNDTGAGSGQSGSGTVPGSASPTAPPSAQDTVGIVAGIEHAALQAGSIAALGATAETAVEAALGNNQAPAPTDPIVQQVQSVAARVEAVELVVNKLVPANVHDRLLAAEQTIAALVTAAEQTAPLFGKLWHFFEVHLGGKDIAPK